MEKIKENQPIIESNSKKIPSSQPKILTQLDHLIADIKQFAFSETEKNIDIKYPSATHSLEEIFAPLKEHVSHLYQRIEAQDKILKKLKNVANKRIKLLLEKDEVNKKRIELEQSKGAELRKHIKNLLDEIVKRRKEREKLVRQLTGFVKKMGSKQNRERLLTELSVLKKKNKALMNEKQEFETALKETEFTYKAKIDASEKKIQRITQMLKEQSFKYKKIVKQIKLAKDKELAQQKEALIRQNKKEVQLMANNYKSKLNQAQIRFKQKNQHAVGNTQDGLNHQIQQLSQPQTANSRLRNESSFKNDARLMKEYDVLKDGRSFLSRIIDHWK
jgi:hypothetical protein